ncbi:MAG: hypothetical protein A2Z20_03470 [Bdellovibrionales bacterium RBG_16_40_8]|nr:MAG: hypothetical protein A2Z20_03470 [Bdellovibrionales bacterium RBG_16_40_8]
MIKLISKYLVTVLAMVSISSQVFASDVREKFNSAACRKGRLLMLLEKYPTVEFPVFFVVKGGEDARSLIDIYHLRGREGALRDRESVHPGVELMSALDEALYIATNERVLAVLCGDPGWGYGEI